MTSTRVHLGLLGGAVISIGGQQTPAKGRSAQRRRLALLALLAATPRHRMTRERVIAYLWPDADSDTGRRNLSEALHVIRRELGEDTLISVGDEIDLNPAVVGSDVSEFRAAAETGDLERAASLYTGAFLDGWFVPGCAELEEWTEQQRQSLKAVYAGILEKLAERAEDKGEWTSAVHHWRARASLDPDAGGPVARLANALALTGDRVGALKAVRGHVMRLRDEGMTVDRPMLGLEERLLQQETGWTPPAPRPVQAVVDQPLAAASAIPVLPSRPRRRSPALLLAAAAIGVAILSVSSLRGSGASGAASQLELDRNRIAVLYFDHRPSEDVGHLADGITGRLIDELSSVPSLRVVSRTGALYFRGRSATIPLDSVARALGAGTLVEGRVERAGDHIRVSVSLVDAGTGMRVGPPRVIERRAEDGLVFTLHDEVASHLAIALRRQLGVQVQMLASRSGTARPGAQELMDRAEFARNTAWAMARHGERADVPAIIRALGAADSLLHLAERADPSWSAPSIARGWVARDASKFAGQDSGAALLRSAISHADRVLVRDPDDAAALELRGVARWTLVANASGRTATAPIALAETDLRAALRADSSRLIAAASLSQLLRVTTQTAGGREEAIVLARHAYERDAFLAHAEDVISMLYRATKAAGAIDSARAWCDRGRFVAPTDWRFTECILGLMRLDLKAADPDAARRIEQQLRLLDPPEKAIAAGRPYSPVYRRLVVAAVDAANGREDSARATLAGVLREVEGIDELSTDAKHEEALVRLALGDRPNGMKALRGYLNRRPEFYPAILSDVAYRQFGLDSSTIAASLQAQKIGSRP